MGIAQLSLRRPRSVALRSVLTADSSRSFLEVGSGPARWMIYFHKTFGYRVSGCDTSPRSCEWARENLAAAGVVATIHQADFFRLEGSYDIVFSGGVVEHFEDPSIPLAAFERLLAPGGILITDVPNLTGLNGWYRRTCSRRRSRLTGRSAWPSCAAGTASSDCRRSGRFPTDHSPSPGSPPRRFPAGHGRSACCGARPIARPADRSSARAVLCTRSALPSITRSSPPTSSWSRARRDRPRGGHESRRYGHSSRATRSPGDGRP